jgi:hypothetical protein
MRKINHFHVDIIAAPTPLKIKSVGELKQRAKLFSPPIDSTKNIQLMKHNIILINKLHTINYSKVCVRERIEIHFNNTFQFPPSIILLFAFTIGRT